MTPRELRADVPGLQDGAYLNFGAHGPSPEYVVDAVSDAVADHEFGSGTDDPYETAFDGYDRARERVAAFIGADPAEVALTESTTDGINRVANAIDFERHVTPRKANNLLREGKGDRCRLTTGHSLSIS